MGKYSETLTEHVMAPRNGGSIENPDLTGHAGNTGPWGVHDPLSEGSRRANHGSEVSHGRLRADDCVGIDVDGDDRGENRSRNARS